MLASLKEESFLARQCAKAYERLFLLTGKRKYLVRWALELEQVEDANNVIKQIEDNWKAR